MHVHVCVCVCISPGGVVWLPGADLRWLKAVSIVIGWWWWVTQSKSESAATGLQKKVSKLEKKVEALKSEISAVKVGNVRRALADAGLTSAAADEPPSPAGPSSLDAQMMSSVRERELTVLSTLTFASAEGAPCFVCCSVLDYLFSPCV